MLQLHFFNIKLIFFSFDVVEVKGRFSSNSEKTVLNLYDKWLLSSDLFDFSGVFFLFVLIAVHLAENIDREK